MYTPRGVKIKQNAWDRMRIHAHRGSTVVVALISSLAPMLLAQQAHATPYEVQVRFDTMHTSSFTSGMACALPATAGTVAKVAITFPTGFVVSGTVGNWTVGTTNTGWPSGGHGVAGYRYRNRCQRPDRHLPERCVDARHSLLLQLDEHHDSAAEPKQSRVIGARLPCYPDQRGGQHRQFAVRHRHHRQ